MTNRERILNTLTGIPGVRPPLMEGLGFSPWGETLARWRSESGIADLDVKTYFGLADGFMTAAVEYGPFPHFEARTLAEDDEAVTVIDYRGLTVRNFKHHGSMPEFIDNPVKTPDDWKHYKEERLSLVITEARCTGLTDYAERMRTLDAPVQAGVFPWGVFGTARDVLGVERLLTGFYDMPGTIHDIMASFTDLWLALYERIHRVIPIDHIHIWEDMCGKAGPLISPAMMEEFMMPQYARIVRFARANAIPLVSVDTDGIVDAVLPVFTRHGINAMLPFEIQAGCDIERYRTEYPLLGIIGGFDKTSLTRTKADMHRELDKAERMLSCGRYIPMFDHLIPPDVPWTDFKYFMNELKRIVN